MKIHKWNAKKALATPFTVSESKWILNSGAHKMSFYFYSALHYDTIYSIYKKGEKSTCKMQDKILTIAFAVSKPEIDLKEYYSILLVKWVLLFRVNILVSEIQTSEIENWHFNQSHLFSILRKKEKFW